jgi:AcrR family transcriptional regulator
MATKTEKRTLSRRGWIDAALEALGTGGVEAVAVEPLARRLGVTKGSFYWHFRDRDELLGATLEVWAGERTEGLIERLDEIEDPRERLERWTRYVLVAEHSVVLSLHAAVEDPSVAPVLRRVTERRIGWLEELLREIGVPPGTARRRARLLYAADLGLFQIAQTVGTPSHRELRALVREIEAAFVD